MATIYDLTDDYAAKLDELGDMILDGQEVSIEQSISILGLQDDIKNKVINIAKYSKGVSATSDALKKEIAKLTARKKANDEFLEKLKASAMAAMALLKTDKIADDIMPVRLQNNSQYSVFVESVDSLPDKYKQVSYTADKKALLADKDSLDIQGVTITKGQHIRFG